METVSGSSNAAVASGVINLSDSRFTATVTVDFDAVVTSDTPMYDSETGQTTTQMTLDSPPAHFSIQSGYDGNGVFVYTQTALDPAGNPLTQSVDDVREVRIANDQISFGDGNGYAAPGTSELPTMSLQDVLGARDTDPLVLLDGLVVTSFPQVGTSAQRAAPDGTSSTATVTNVVQSGSTTTVSTLIHSSDGTTPDLPQQRVYTWQGDAYMLSEIKTQVSEQMPGASLSGQAVIRFDQVSYVRNAQEDQLRRGGENTWFASSAPPAQELTPYQCTELDYEQGRDCGPDPGSPPYSGPTGCALNPTAPGAANLVYVHGILSNGSAWGTGSAGTSAAGGVVGPVRCALQVASETAPSLEGGQTKGRGPHAAQATELFGVVQNKTQSVFIAHSQGGLISRRVAQTLWNGESNHANGRVRAVVTTGTPHTGALIANTLNPSPGMNGLIKVLGGGVACRLGGLCGTRVSLTGLRDDFLAAAFSSPAMANLKPNSDAIRDVNLPVEAFPRYGITNAIPKRWAVARVAGDWTSANNGASVVNVVKTAYAVAIAGAIISGVVALIPGVSSIFASVSAKLAYVAVQMNATDLWWTRITVGGEQGDGVVPVSSQTYPNATLIYATPQASAVSHTAEIDTGRSAEAIKDVLRRYVQVPPRT